MLAKSKTSNFISIEYDHLPDDHQQQIFELNSRQSAPASLRSDTISQTFATTLGDRIVINNLPLTKTNNNSTYICEKISIEITSVQENTLHLKITLSKNSFAAEHYSPAKM